MFEILAPLQCLLPQIKMTTVRQFNHIIVVIKESAVSLNTQGKRI